jgi:WD40 repeat protein
MSGQVMMHRISGEIVDQKRDHSKYAVQVTFHYDESQSVIATAGWDQKVHIYMQSPDLLTAIQDPDPDATFFGDPVHTISLPSNPESLVFVRHPDTNTLYLILSRRDSTHLYYYSITAASDPDAREHPVREAGRQNLAPHSNAWIAFTPSCLSTCPTDPTLLAIATSHLPHMKLIVVRLLFPDASSTVQPQTQAAMARSMLAMQDREDAAIRLHISTLAPQTPYSTPQVVWRPDGTGVWVNGDDGAIRGIEMQSGKVVAVLKGHEPGTKVRTLWAGQVSGKRGELGEGDDRGGREVLVSGGFDKRVFVWGCGEGNAV